jgi:predicted nucleotidyltransferase
MLNLDKIIPELHNFFARQADVVLAYIYGSYATVQAREDSDLDIAILYREDIAPGEQVRLSLRYANEIRKLTRASVEIDIRELNLAPADFKMQVIKPRQCLYAVDGRERVRFEAEVIIEYLDFKPVLDLYYNTMLQNLSEGNTLYGLEFRNRLGTAE